MALLSSFGIEWKLLIAQIINFGVLVFILWKLVYKPLLKVLDDRTRMAKEAEEKSHSVDSKLDEIRKLEEETLMEARKTGAELIKNAETAAATLRAKLEAEAGTEALKVVREAEVRMKAEQDKMHTELKNEMKEIVASAIESTVGKYLDASAKHKLAEEANHEALAVEKFVGSHK